MSTNLMLIKYRLGINGRYLEDSGELIASSFISEENLSALINEAPLAKLTIYEEDGSDEFSEIDCLQNQEIDKALRFARKKFIDLFKKTDLSAIENSDDDSTEALSKFRSISNLYYLLEIKHAKYQSDDTVVVKLG